MATTVTRDLKEITDEVKQLDKEIKQSTNETKKLDKSLRLDPTNVTLLSAKTENLQKSVSNATRKIKLLKQQQDQLRASDPNAVNTESYKKLTIEIAKTEVQVKSLKKTMQEANNVSLAKLEAGLKKASTAATVAIGAVVALETAYAKAGDNISKASDKYNISAEAFQKNSYVFERVTSDTEGYSKALTEVQSKLSQAAKGSAKAITSFEALGITTEDLAGIGASEALDLVIEKLQGIADYDERVTLANELLASSGTEVAMIAGLTSEELDELNQKAEQAGIISQAQADDAAALSDKMSDLKNQYAAVFAELANSLLPMMEGLMAIASALAPVIQALSNTFKAIGAPLQTTIALLAVALIVLPKIVAGIKAVNTAMTLVGANPINLKIIAIAAAVAALITLLVELAKWLGSIFNKKYSLDVDASSLGASSEDLLAQATSTGSSAAVGNTYITNNYDIEQNNTVNNDLDIDEVAEQLTTKIRVGGGR